MEQENCRKTRKRGQHLTKEERIKIEVLNNRKVPPREIAEEIGCSIRTIQRELQRGKVMRKNSELIEFEAYSSDRGDAVYKNNVARRGYSAKIKTHPEINQYIFDAIKVKRWSPDVISHRMESEIGIKVCTKTIYNYIDMNMIKGVNNGMLLEKVYRKKRSKKAVLRKDKRCPERKSIEERPEEVNSREEFGHWEIDLIVGKRKGSDAALLTLTERKTRYPYIIKLKNQTQKAVINALNKLERKLGATGFTERFKTITADNGSEFLDVKGLESSCLNKGKRTDFYYAHPYASWERGSNENMNKMTRRFVPKGCDIGKFNNKQIEDIEDFLRNYPRKILGYKTPEECYKCETV